MSPIGIRLGHGNGRTAVAPATNVGADTAPHPLFSQFAAFLPWELWLSMRFFPLRGCSSCRRTRCHRSAPCDRSCSEAPSALLTHHTRAPLQQRCLGSKSMHSCPAAAALTLPPPAARPQEQFESESTGSSGFPRRPGLNPWRLLGQGPLPPDPPTCFLQQNLPGCQHCLAKWPV